jgi:putative phosphoribosyl transferase
MRFANRTQAGQQLAKQLSAYAQQTNTIVLALPRGGLPTAYQVSQYLNLPLDIILVQKLGVPGNEELAMGAIAYGEAMILNDEIIRMLSLSEEVIQQARAQQQQEIQRRNQLYRQGRAMPALQNKTVILIDDGIATGATMQAAIQAVRYMQANKVVVAVPVAPLESNVDIAPLVDEFICLSQPEPFYSVGNWYESFPQLTDQQVINYLQGKPSNETLS